MKSFILIILATLLAPVLSFASLDCEDVIYMSRESTRLSAEVAQLPRGLQTSAHQAHVIDIAYKVVGELEETVQLPAANVTDRDYDRFQTIQQKIHESSADAELVRQLERGDLQYLNSLRVNAMSNIRQLYARCLAQ